MWKKRMSQVEAERDEVELDIKGLILENDRLNGIIITLHTEIENLKTAVKDLDKSDNIIRDLENKLKFYIDENDKLNKILVSRSTY